MWIVSASPHIHWLQIDAVDLSTIVCPTVTVYVADAELKLVVDPLVTVIVAVPTEVPGVKVIVFPLTLAEQILLLEEETLRLPFDVFSVTVNEPVLPWFTVPLVDDSVKSNIPDPAIAFVILTCLLPETVP